jgi:hypothetical protein
VPFLLERYRQISATGILLSMSPPVHGHAFVPDSDPFAEPAGIGAESCITGRIVQRRS